MGITSVKCPPCHTKSPIMAYTRPCLTEIDQQAMHQGRVIQGDNQVALWVLVPLAGTGDSFTD